MSENLDHVLLTRFNLPTPGAESLIRAREGWLRRRVELFEKFCVPSVRAQTNRNFHWIVYFDPQSPAWLLERNARFAAEGLFVPVYRESVSPEQLVGDLRAVTGGTGSVLITTNLDNDDGIAVDFVDRIQNCTPTGTRDAVYLGRGLILSPHDLHLRTDRHNAFCSVREGWDAPGTCWLDWHDLLHRHMPVTILAGEPGWLQVVHGTNVSNRVRGRRVRRGAYPALFPGLLDDVEDPTAGELVLARLVVEPLRAAREFARNMAKKLARALFGKAGLDRIKNRLASRHSSSTSSGFRG